MVYCIVSGICLKLVVMGFVCMHLFAVFGVHPCLIYLRGEGEREKEGGGERGREGEREREGKSSSKDHGSWKSIERNTLTHTHTSAGAIRVAMSEMNASLSALSSPSRPLSNPRFWCVSVCV